MRRFLFATMIAVAFALIGCGSPCPDASTALCGNATVTFGSSCGLAKLTSTCAVAPSCDATSCTLAPSAPETCDASILLGDGTSHAAHLVFTRSTAPTDSCHSGCTGELVLALTVDGVDAGNSINGRVTSFSSATCHESDAGVDGSLDAATDGATE